MKDGLHIAVEAAQGLGLANLGRSKPSSTSSSRSLRVLALAIMGTACRSVGRDLVVIEPVMHRPSAGRPGTRGGRAINVPAPAEEVDGNGRLVAVGHGGDDVARAEGGVAAEKDPGAVTIAG
jgi:hypothetical protein